MICKYIKINIKPYYNYLYDYDTFTDNQIYRLIQISDDLNIYEKLYLYTNNNSKTLELITKEKYVFENIYNIEYLLSGKVFDLKTDINDIDNKKYNKEIYKTSILKQIKEIRKKVFGNAEDDIDINMIPIAYEKYGLFWNPN